MRGTGLPRHGILLHGLLGSADNLLLESTFLRQTTGETITQAGQGHTETELLSGCLTLFMVYRGFQCPPGLLQARRITWHRNRQTQATRALKTHECPFPSKFHSAGCSSESMANKTNAAFVLVWGKQAKKTSTKQSS